MKRSLKGLAVFWGRLSPTRLVAIGYLAYAVAGWIVLCLPVVQAKSVTWLDNLFTSVSALSTTGLVTVSTSGSYNLLGQAIILLLIQVGGIGYMTFGSFVVLSRTGALPERRREIARTVFSVPADLHIDHLLRSVIVFTAIIEAAGAAALYGAFRHAGVQAAAWSSIFHSISAFCTAGFSLYDNSLEAYRSDFWINTILGIVSYLGAVGFIVCLDVWRRVTGRARRITLTSRIILISTFWLTVAGMLLFFICEPSIRALDTDDRLLASLFQVMAALTTVGFNSIPISQLSQASLFLMILLMLVGASPSGTGGGLKTTTFTAILGVMRSAMKGAERVYFWGKEIPAARVWLAMASLGFYAGSLILGSFLLALSESHGFENLLFEAASALGTVGLSTGITSQLTHVGKLIVIALMFVGRIGPLAFGLSLFCGGKEPRPSGQEDLAV
ncbi:MAG TPA: potassium transporter TrkG [Kiritimatiellia bacterium]|nr:potassium transporter TrkG [Kiritimatiellia bacterium]HRZ13491.1 potassium transporter TrkG [Kiritimatiellia bacterium]HSA19204.1 potassium transporter TrkG [Kiritimatiellia bacterium]